MAPAQPGEIDGGPGPAGAEIADPAGRFRDVLGYLGTGSDRLAACTHLPAPGTPVVGGVVVCPSLFNEFLKNYRREVSLSRALAARGIVTVRFAYRGTGNSDGHELDTTLGSMVEDAATALDHATTVVGTTVVGGGPAPVVIGTRFGALVAARAAADRPGAAVVLVEPVATASAYFEEGFRNRLFAAGIRTRRDDDSGGARRVEDLLAQIETEGVVDLLGYSVGRDLYRSCQGASVVGSMGPGPRSVLVVQLGAAQPVRADISKLASGLEEGSVEVAVERVGGKEQWWLPEEREGVPGAAEARPHGLDDDDPLVDVVGAWVSAHLGGTW